MLGASEDTVEMRFGSKGGASLGLGFWWCWQVLVLACAGWTLDFRWPLPPRLFVRD